MPATDASSVAAAVDLPGLLDALLDGGPLADDDVTAVFAAMVDGALEPVQIAAWLVAWRARGETPSQLAAAAGALRDAAVAFPGDAGAAIDVCGTGGDRAGTLNISTAAALVVAAAGVPVVKHGNRAVSSRCGSADVLEACGVRVDVEPATAAADLAALGVCFLFAPRYHPGLRHAMPARRALRVRTAFNLLGPLVNPARPGLQLLGVFDPAWVEPLAHTLQALGVRRARVVHGAGTDELALHGPSVVARLDDDGVRVEELTPEAVGLTARPLEELKADAPEDSAHELRAVLGGGGRPAFRDAVALNAGAALEVAGAVDDVAGGVERALRLMSDGAPAALLERWTERHRGLS